MAEEVVEDVGLHDVVELVLLADPAGDREATAREVLEEDEVGHEPGNRHEPPAGGRAQLAVDDLEAGDAGRVVERAQGGLVLGAGASRDELDLPAVEPSPAVVLRPRCRRRGPARRCSPAACGGSRRAGRGWTRRGSRAAPRSWPVSFRGSLRTSYPIAGLRAVPRSTHISHRRRRAVAEWPGDGRRLEVQAEVQSG